MKTIKDVYAKAIKMPEPTKAELAADWERRQQHKREFAMFKKTMPKATPYTKEEMAKYGGPVVTSPKKVKPIIKSVPVPMPVTPKSMPVKPRKVLPRRVPGEMPMVDPFKRKPKKGPKVKFI